MSSEKDPQQGGVSETLRVAFQALIIALVIRTFLFQSFNIPSESMESTLLVGDYLFLSKYSYGYTHYSLPFSPPLFSGRIFGSEPKPGDVVVFRLPSDDSVDFIKRVIGLPGEIVEGTNGVVFVNGLPLDEPYVAPENQTFPSRQLGADEYFVMGDNRGNSQDSRSFGPIHTGNIVGRAWIIYWPPTDWAIVPHHTFAAAESP